MAYWRQEQWLAAGPSASAHVGSHRWKNVPRLDDYLEFDDRGFAPITDHEPPDDRRALAERLMTGLRVAEGLPIADTLQRAGSAADRLSLLAHRFADSGHLEERDGRWRPTDSGFLIADTIAAEFMGALDD
jgi:oxygen-independent coproporphyrinogen-3 oxidase